jgi:hypothetical protein
MPQITVGFRFAFTVVTIERCNMRNRFLNIQIVIDGRYLNFITSAYNERCGKKET